MKYKKVKNPGDLYNAYSARMMKKKAKPAKGLETAAEERAEMMKKSPKKAHKISKKKISVKVKVKVPFPKGQKISNSKE